MQKQRLTITPPLPLEHIPVNPYRLDAARIIRFWAIHPTRNPPNLQARKLALTHDSARVPMRAWRGTHHWFASTWKTSLATRWSRSKGHLGLQHLPNSLNLLSPRPHTEVRRNNQKTDYGKSILEDTKRHASPARQTFRFRRRV